MKEVLLLIGGNLGDREQVLHATEELIGKCIGNISDHSSIYETAPWGFSSDKPFLNRVLRIKSELDPLEILEQALIIEKKMGRKRTSGGYTSRIIDIDILLIDGLEIHEDGLTVPHPRLHERKFTLQPLAEIAGNWKHPVLNKTISELNEECMDDLPVEVYKKIPS